MADSKKYNGSTWQHSLRKLGTSTDTITTLPVDVYADGNNATVGLKGNTVQSGTPSPDNPVMPQGCGDLETVGAKAGQYKIPISSGGATTNIYLGSTQSIRQIGKLILTGDENWGAHAAIGNWYYVDNIFIPIINVGAYCDRYNFALYSSAEELTNGQFTFGNPGGITSIYRLIFKDTAQATVTNFKTYLQQQYANGTPVTVWYVLKTSTTGIVNEPLMKIGDYADIVSDITVPTITGKDTFDVETTLKPSEVSLSYTGWHDATVEEWNGSQWNE